MFDTPETRKEESLTDQMFADPQVGDQFSEMYSFCMYVVERRPNYVTTMEASAPCRFPEDGKVNTYTLDEFRKRFSYGSIKGYWVRGNKRGVNVSGWYVNPEMFLHPYA